MSGIELAALAPALGAGTGGAAAAGASGIPGGIAGLFGAGAASPMATSLLGPAAATPFVTEGAMLGAAPGLSLGAPPAVGKSLLGLLGKGANAASSVMGDEQEAPPAAPLPQQQPDNTQFADIFTKYLDGLDPASRRMLMTRMGGMR